MWPVILIVEARNRISTGSDYGNYVKVDGPTAKLSGAERAVYAVKGEMVAPLSVRLNPLLCGLWVRRGGPKLLANSSHPATGPIARAKAENRAPAATWRSSGNRIAPHTPQGHRQIDSPTSPSRTCCSRRGRSPGLHSLATCATR